MQTGNKLEASLQYIRRLAIAKQYLHDEAKPELLELIKNMGCIQLDPISAVEQSHLLVLWSRLGNFNRKLLDTLRWEDKAVFEYLAHAASLVLTEEYPIYAWNMAKYSNNTQEKQKVDRWLKNVPNRQELEKNILQRLKEDKSVLSREIKDDVETRGPKSRWWSNRYVPNLIHALWLSGNVTVVNRKGKQKCWGLIQDFLPKEILNKTWTENEITTFCIQKSIKTLGIATKKQIKNNFTRNKYPTFEQTIQKLIKQGVLIEVVIAEFPQNSKDTWYIHAEDLRILDSIKNGKWKPRTTILSPFDNLICDRDRTEQLFNFHYRIEIYTPKEKRKFGYYVMPILDGDKIVGRINPHMNRKNSILTIHKIYKEEGVTFDSERKKRINFAIESLAKFLGAKEIIFENKT